MKKDLTTKQLMNEWRLFTEQSTPGSGLDISKYDNICNSFGQVAYDVIEKKVFDAVPEDVRIELDKMPDINIGKIIRGKGGPLETLAVKQGTKLGSVMDRVGKEIKSQVVNTLDGDELWNSPGIKGVYDFLEEIAPGRGNELLDKMRNATSAAFKNMPESNFGVLAMYFVNQKKSEVEDVFKVIELSAIKSALQSESELIKILVEHALDYFLFNHTRDSLMKAMNIELKGFTLKIVNRIGISTSGPVFKGRDECLESISADISSKLEEKLKVFGICGLMSSYRNVIRAYEKKDFASFIRTFPKLFDCLQKNNKWLAVLLKVYGVAKNPKKAKDLLARIETGEEGMSGAGAIS